MELMTRTSMDTSNALAALAALAQESRLAVFRLLVGAGPSGMVAKHIAENLGVPASSLSFHLKELSHAGLIESTQDGRFIIYAANFGTMNALVAFLTENCCGGNPCSPVLQAQRATDSSTC
jgi:ArsR family transcriptional regulator, arsenate/arsenite/antimonite-responsive transcriptional repressor